jgi:hypothetical protein
MAPNDDDAADDVSAEDILVQRKEVFGKLYVISLKDIYALLGEHSPRVEDGVELACQRAIERHIGSRETFEFMGGGFYIFRFDERTPEEGWALAKQVVDEVGSFFLGERYHPSEDSPMVRVALVDAAEIKDRGGDFIAHKVDEHLDMVHGKSSDQVFKDWHEFHMGRAAQDDDPVWVPLHRPGKAAGPEARAQPGHPAGAGEHRTGTDRRKVDQQLWGRAERRKGSDRRGPLS